MSETPEQLLPIVCWDTSDIQRMHSVTNSWIGFNLIQYYANVTQQFSMYLCFAYILYTYVTYIMI